MDPTTIAAIAAIAAAFATVVLVIITGWYASETRKTRLEADRRHRAEIEIRFQERHPYWWPELRWYRLGIYNLGPSTAENVEAWLVSIEPTNPMRVNVLPSRLGRKGGSTRDCRINPQGEDWFDVLQFEVIADGHSASVHFHTEEQPTPKNMFVMNATTEYRIGIRVTAANANARSREFILRGEELRNLSFFPVDA